MFSDDKVSSKSGGRYPQSPSGGRGPALAASPVPASMFGTYPHCPKVDPSIPKLTPPVCGTALIRQKMNPQGPSVIECKGHLASEASSSSAKLMTHQACNGHSVAF